MSNKPHIIALDDEQLNAVLNALADKPYREAAPTIFAINRQLEARQRPPELVQTPAEGESNAA